VSIADEVAVRFPSTTATAPRRQTSTKKNLVGIVGVVATLAAVVLSVVRTPDFGATDTIWAEDGRRFYQGTLQHNFFDLLFTPYNGYLHLVPRVLVEIVRIFPLAWAAVVIAIMGALMASLCALLVYRASARHLRWPALRIAVAAPVALSYVGQQELANNFAGLHLLLLYVAFWMVIWNPARRSLQLLAAFVLFAAVGSDPVAALYLPLAILRYRTVRGWRGLFPAAAIGIGLAFQAVGIVLRDTLHSRAVSPHYDPWWATDHYFQAVIGQGLYTEQLNERLGNVVTPGDAHYVAWAFGAAVLALALARVTQPNWPLILVALVHSLLLFDGLVMQGGNDSWRYELPAICLFLVAVAGALIPREGSPLRAPWKVLKAIPAFAALALVTLCIFAGYAQDMDWRGNGPSFAAQLSQAAQTCRDPHVTEAEIKVAPAFAAWTMTVPCDLVRARNGFFELSP